MTLDLIIPTYNRMGLLELCLESAFRAKVPEGLRVRVVVVDNNSKDETKAVAERMGRRSPVEFEYLFVERAGKSAALNESIGRSSADLIGMIDDDEQIDEHWFEVVEREFAADPELAFLGGPYLPNFECEPPKWIPDTYQAVIGIVKRERVERFGSECKGMLMGGNAVVRREALLKVMPYPEKLGRIGNGILVSGEDEVIYHRLLDAGLKGIAQPDLKIYHWIPKSRMTKKYYRRWAFGNGTASVFRKAPDVPHLFGIPRYKFRTLSRWFAQPTSLERQLDAIECLGSLYGMWHRKKLREVPPGCEPRECYRGSGQGDRRDCKLG
jgi:glycosyltransferase involved in cell wall biosynthesis